jgi:hypothetical protein
MKESLEREIKSVGERVDALHARFEAQATRMDR